MSQVIEEELTSLITQVNNIISKQFVFYTVQFGDESFDFSPPLFAEDKERILKEKKKFLKLVFNDALKTLIDNIVEDNEPTYDNLPWKTVDNFLMSALEETDVLSGVTAEALQGLKDQAAIDAKEGVNKIALDVESPTVMCAMGATRQELADAIEKREKDVS
jgi:hypothetical protein